MILHRTPAWWAVELSKLALVIAACFGALVAMALTYPERMPHG